VSARTVTLDLAGQHQLARDLMAGGVFVPKTTMELNEECELVLLGNGDDEVRAQAIVVFANASGVGLQLHNCDADLKQQIATLAAGVGVEIPPPAPPPQSARIAVVPLAAAAAPVEPEPVAIESAASETDANAEADAADVAAADADAAANAEPETEESKKLAANVHERMRGLTMAQQIKYAHTGEASERIVLERLYGKNVWEGLLRNPRLTGPEVARIARMGSLPRPLMEIIVGNGGWLQIPEVRRALLSNPRLAPDHINKILRMLPKHELKLAAAQTAYPMAVRDVAKRMIKEMV
jgi:hypothetical protein